MLSSRLAQPSTTRSTPASTGPPGTPRRSQPLGWLTFRAPCPILSCKVPLPRAPSCSLRASSSRNVPPLASRQSVLRSALVGRGAGARRLAACKLARRLSKDRNLSSSVRYDNMTTATPPLVSCLCVTRHKPQKLRRAVACFIAQSYPNKELVIVYETDDRATMTLLEEYAGRDGIRCLAVDVQEPRVSAGASRALRV